MRLCTRLRDEAIHKEGRDGVACFVLRRQIWGWELVARRKQLAAAGWLGGGRDGDGADGICQGTRRYWST